jgi:hypothetical protein
MYSKLGTPGVITSHALCDDDYDIGCMGDPRFHLDGGSSVCNLVHRFCVQWERPVLVHYHYQWRVQNVFYACISYSVTSV